MKERIINNSPLVSFQLQGDNSLIDNRTGEIFYKEREGSWINIDRFSGEYIKTNPDFSKNLDYFQHELDRSSIR